MFGEVRPGGEFVQFAANEEEGDVKGSYRFLWRRKRKIENGEEQGVREVIV